MNCCPQGRTLLAWYNVPLDTLSSILMFSIYTIIHVVVSSFCSAALRSSTISLIGLRYHFLFPSRAVSTSTFRTFPSSLGYVLITWASGHSFLWVSFSRNKTTSPSYLGFTMQICSKSEWGSTSTVLMFMLYWREQMIGNCTYLLRNTRPTHTVNI